ncbi:MAG: RNA methyltransferase [Bacteroidaceae bacterium]|nr:RNA methyltransferase [Bacteroidaceae bacterium]
MISKNQIKYLKSLELKKFRDQHGVFVAEGPKVVNDLKGHFELVELLEGEDADRVSFLDTPQHVFAVFKKAAEVSIPSPHDELMLALDDVQNPGNLGTIIRLADWFGITHILCSRGCADVYNPKVVQATMGALARVQIHETDLPQTIANLQSGAEFPVYGTFLDGDNIYQSTLQPHGLIVMGNEGHGISAEVATLVSHRLLIPNYPQGRETSESLNVAIATAIVCSEFRRRE